MKPRKFLTQREVYGLIRAAGKGRTGVRDSCLILLAFRHGYRISELLSLSFGDIDLEAGRIYIRRLKNGLSTVHPLMPDEIAALHAWRDERMRWRDADEGAVFISLRGTRLSRKQAWRIIRQAGEVAGTITGTHPHMLRHACGYELAERGTDTRLIQDYLGHRNIRHTVRYTASNAARFAGIWDRENILDRNKVQKSEEKNTKKDKG
ncbi:tyrosine-type DNA invertase [Pantoea ananatis]|uniref:tyrosine-type DNA invertase n=1 Tax=Pantoea ananas TaxID=553 RepID=UPI000F89BB9E|nr:tyrosine-type DNA invertase [Pantoea ananatis]RQN05302.1 tyrosine recombinase [Pantoea ananatis]